MKSVWKLVEAFLLVPTNQNVKIMEIINSNSAMDQPVFVGVQRPRLVRKYQELKREEVLTARNMKVRFLRWLNWLNISFFLFLFPNLSTMRIWEFYFLRYFTVEAVYGKDLYVSNSSFAHYCLLSRAVNFANYHLVPLSYVRFVRSTNMFYFVKNLV